MRNPAFAEYIRSTRLQRNIALGEFIADLTLAAARRTIQAVEFATGRAKRHAPTVIERRRAHT